MHIKITDLNWILQLAIQYFKNSFVPIPQPLWNWSVLNYTITRPPQNLQILFQLFANVKLECILDSDILDCPFLCKLDINSTYLKPDNSQVKERKRIATTTTVL